MIDGSVIDVEMGTVWDDAGRAISGALVGETLEKVPSRSSFWFALAVSLPDIELYEQVP
ncbi:MAG TPA: hypothetical protein QF520_15025 [SAR202 cluster bacterium]|nr:DUF3179 domain-containing (seleno)protein [SAR202 cluster bacterium]MDP7224089.1 DUF3179 domain-containing (seleno)protein [SAR202 cluster bacterium]HJO83699.1 hypothetical protein [SAR202 cluster bacterium]